MGLKHPRSLEDWQHWQASRHRARRAKHTLGGVLRSVRRDGASAGSATGATAFVLHSRSGADGGVRSDRRRLLIGVDSASPTSLASLLGVLPYLEGDADVLAPVGLDLPDLVPGAWTAHQVQDVDRTLSERAVTTVLTLGQHLPVGRAAHGWAHRAGVCSVVVQHGALTPFAPPLPPETTFLAWTAADGDFQRSGREDVRAVTVGAQLLWEAAHGHRPPEHAADTDSLPSDSPVFLGQMHGAELPRRITALTAASFCRAEGAVYRPHPAETDVLSRTVHTLMRHRGIHVEDPLRPLAASLRPVVGIFSTGVLEAAAAGIPSWVHAPRAPGWVHEFWERYGMRQWTGSSDADPTPAPAPPDGEPARHIAQFLEEEA